MKKILLSAVLLAVSLVSSAQVGIGTTNPHTSAALEISSTTKGLLIPRMTKAQADLITDRPEGLLIYCTDCTLGGKGLYASNGTDFVNVQNGNTMDGAAPTGTVASASGSAAATDANEFVPYTGSATVSYLGGNGGIYDAQTVNSTGVTGLTATLASGTFADGTSGTVTYNISGTPDIYSSTPISANNNNAVFNVTIGGKSATLTVNVIGQPYLEVAGKKWMDRNLGAPGVATSSTDTANYGDLYQWGRESDGHQLRTSSTIAGQQANTYSDPNFITVGVAEDWTNNPDANLWNSGTEGAPIKTAKDPCPTGYRIPTKTEFQLLTGVINNATDAFNLLKLPLSGGRFYEGNVNRNIGISGFYWTSGGSGGSQSDFYNVEPSSTAISLNTRAHGNSIRCIRE